MRLARRRRPGPGELSGQGPTGRRRWLGEVDAAGLEQRQAPGTASEVVAGGVEQAAEQGRPHQRLIGGDRVVHRDGVSPRVVVEEPEPVGEARVDE